MRTFVLIALIALAALCVADNAAMFERALAAQDGETNKQHTWVVLVAGSTSYMNYRHQASVCHAYQVAHKYGVPDSHIIVFMADDIANSPQNPFPGKIYNYFYIKGGNNVNVYKGVPKDYTEENATADNLVAVLTGMDPVSGSRKTLKTTKDDNVFFYYDDHGNTDIIAMPTGRRFTGSEDMKKVFDQLSAKKNYKNWVIFIQACYSGSLFYKQNIPDNVYVATSAPTDASAYACWWDNTLSTYVTSCWPRGWLRPMDEEDPSVVTFDKLFADAWEFTKNSTQPCQYGDADVKKLTMKEFFGITTRTDTLGQTRDVELEKNAINVPQEDVPLFVARMRYKKTGSEEDRIAVQNELRFRAKIDKIVALAADAAIPEHSGLMRTDICTKCDSSCKCYSNCLKKSSEESCKRTCCGYAECYPSTLENSNAIDCASTLVRAFEATCGKANNDYTLSATKAFNRICRTPGHNVNAAIKVFNQYC